ncbi:MAG: glutamate 5-kinase [Rhodospirillaceae bacterium]|jgi:glutamate 5-kinase|nr:glutamate 5-kinase [Rhodospirillaceae bacterium]MBT5014396.1 glutamate 5-kinase [Rhodospirillaceae bacterium]MBT5307860.1 glutamate 5-kinase [Rhodospirillaceae bacterium]MBT7354961.1 glutamate 5-kinase [Rhodospirillaceae bacterium]
MSPHRQTTDLSQAKRIVVKIGSSLLVDESKGTIHRTWLAAMADDIAACRARGQQVVIVSSGAVAVGRKHLGFDDGRTLRLEEKQAAAATGQLGLAHAYEEELARHDLTVAQVLMTLDDSDNRRRYINARNTLETLLKLGAVPLINENDTVATDEIRMGDNDRLGARVAAMTGADTLVLLSDVDGLYTADPGTDATATVVAEVHEITPEIEAMAGESRPGVGTGGMVTKLAAAKFATEAGSRMVIASGRELHPLRRIEDGATATWFLPKETTRSARKHWIAGTLSPSGSITVDAGALSALQGGKSLLPAGVVAVEGNFQKGDAVTIKTPDGDEIGRGLMAYSADDARLLAGHKSSEIEALLGYRGGDEMIHRDDLVMS